MTDFDDLRRHARLVPSAEVLQTVHGRATRKRRAAAGTAGGTALALAAALALALPAGDGRPDSLQPAEPVTVSPRPLPSEPSLPDTAPAPDPAANTGGPALPAPAAAGAPVKTASPPVLPRPDLPTPSTSAGPTQGEAAPGRSDAVAAGRYQPVVRTYEDGAAPQACDGRAPGDNVPRYGTAQCHDGYVQEDGDSYLLIYTYCVSVTASTSRRLDFEGGSEVDWQVAPTDHSGWRWQPDGTGAAHSLTIKPGDCVRWETRWLAVTDQGSTVSNTEAEMSAALLGGERPRATSTFHVA